MKTCKQLFFNRTQEIALKINTLKFKKNLNRMKIGHLWRFRVTQGCLAAFAVFAAFAHQCWASRLASQGRITKRQRYIFPATTVSASPDLLPSVWTLRLSAVPFSSGSEFWARGYRRCLAAPSRGSHVTCVWSSHPLNRLSPVRSISGFILLVRISFKAAATTVLVPIVSGID